MSSTESLIARVDALARGDAVMRAKLETVVALLVRSIPDCDTASISIVLTGQAMTAASFDHVALEVDLLQYHFEEGPCLDAAGLGDGGGHVVRVDLMHDRRYRRFAPGAIDASVTSALSLPCTSSAGRTLGSVNLYSKGGSFSAASEEAAAPAVAFVSDLLENSLIYAAAIDLVTDVTSTVETSAIVNQAVGIIMASRNCTAEAAIAALGATATARGQDLRTAGEAVINGRALIDET